MKINELTNSLTRFTATIRVVLPNSTTMVKTEVVADGLMQARALLIRLYGPGSVLSLTQAISEATKTLSSSELQVRALADKAEDYKQQAKVMKARQGVTKAQGKLRQLTSTSNANV